MFAYLVLIEQTGGPEEVAPPDQDLTPPVGSSEAQRFVDQDDRDPAWPGGVDDEDLV